MDDEQKTAGSRRLTKEDRAKGRSRPLKPRELNMRQAKFVAEMLKGSTARAAAETAGYTMHPKDSAARLMRTPVVREALAVARKAAADTAAYNGAEAMGELREAMEFSKRTENATAFCRAIELRAKLMGLLDADKGGQGGSLVFNISGVDFSGSPKTIEVDR